MRLYWTTNRLGIRTNWVLAPQQTIGFAGQGGDAQLDGLRNIENLVGSSHDDTLTGDAGVNRIDGGDGDDVSKAGQAQIRLPAGPGQTPCLMRLIPPV